jgi:hypothetical protein
MSKPFKILLVLFVSFISVALVLGTYADIRGGSEKTDEGIRAVEEASRELDKFQK